MSISLRTHKRRASAGMARRLATIPRYAGFQRICRKGGVGYMWMTEAQRAAQSFKPD